MRSTIPTSPSEKSYNRIFLRTILITLTITSFTTSFVYAQIMYQNVSNKNVAMGSYGRVGVDWSFEDGGSIGRRLNLKNMGSIGGRMEEQDYLEVAPAFYFAPKKGDSTQIYAQMRLSMYTTSLTTFGNSSSTSLGGLAFAMPEMYVEARNIRAKT